MEPENRSALVQSRLPWLIAAAALLFYLLTLNRWVCLSSLPTAASIAARDWTPPITGPLSFLVTFPFRWLPSGWQAIALNALAAVCGAATLGLLARSVALLPHDRTRDERQREQSEFSRLSIPASWAPPLFAALVCGLQLTFWENATAATGEMLDLLLFAYGVRCLLEYRAGENNRWLYRLALVYGLAVTNNYAMIGFFPAFLIALIWIKGKGLFEFHFVVRMVGFGCAGLLLYLLLPLLNSLSESSGNTFWGALKYQLAYQKGALQYTPLRSVILIAALTSLLPVLVIGVRWPSSFGDTSVVGSYLTQFVFHVVHAIFLAACIWVAFDSPLSPRWQIARKFQGADLPNLPWSFLGFYYLGALGIGYFVGYYLLVFGKPAGKAWQKDPGTLTLLNRAVIALTWATIIAVPVGLIYRNLAAVRSNNGVLLHQFAALAAERLQSQGSIALSDQPYILSLVEAYNQSAGTKSDMLLADTRLLRYPAYHYSLHRSHPRIWPELPATTVPGDQINPVFLMEEVARLAASNQVYYLHPSFGYYFERVYLVPDGLIYRLRPFGTNQTAQPSMSERELETNAAFWKRVEPAMAQLAEVVKQGAIDGRALGRWYSRAVNLWGVELQRSGRLRAAAEAYGLALKLNPQNVSAEINLSFNANLQAGNAKSIDIGRNVEDRFGSRYRSWDAVLAADGPLDEPGFCFQLGQTLARQSLFRQAAFQFIRSLQLDPDNLSARLWLANVFLLGQAPDKVLETTREIRTRLGAAALNVTNQAELVRLEATAHFESDRFQEAEKMLLTAHQRYPEARVIDDTLLQIYLQSNRLTNALSFIDEQLRQKPDNTDALLTRALVCMKIPAYDQASAAVADVLKRDPDHVRGLLISGTIHVQTRTYPEALAALDRVLKLEPENLEALLTKSGVLIQTKAYGQALGVLDRMLALQPNNQPALLNRAIARLQSGRLDDARRDYETLEKILPPNQYPIQFGLGEIAYQRKDFPAAIRYYETYLKYAPQGTGEAKGVEERLKQLKSAGR